MHRWWIRLVKIPSRGIVLLQESAVWMWTRKALGWRAEGSDADVGVDRACSARYILATDPSAPGSRIVFRLCRWHHPEAGKEPSAEGWWSGNTCSVFGLANPRTHKSELLLPFMLRNIHYYSTDLNTMLIQLWIGFSVHSMKTQLNPLFKNYLFRHCIEIPYLFV